MSEAPIAPEQEKAERAAAIWREAWFAGHICALMASPATPVSHLFEMVQQSNAVTAYCEWLSWQPAIYPSQLWLYIQANPKMAAALQTMEAARDALGKINQSGPLP